MRLPVHDRLARGFLDAFGCVEVRFADLQVNDVFSLLFQLHGPLQDVHDNERGQITAIGIDYGIEFMHSLVAVLPEFKL